jgi:putative IMPACT (imprinted ancient) family translation regulator
LTGERVSGVRVEAEAEITVKRSRFVAAWLSVEQAPALDAWLRARRRALRKACHHCWGARLRQADGRVLEQARDDGEVGRPGFKLLELLRARELEGALVVSRFFGGIKLGPGGVGRAFREVGIAALDVKS